MRQRSLALALPFVVAACAHLPRGAKEDVLPLERVRLYESGVAYYERSGPIGSRGASLPVPASHLDDAIKSLVVLGSEGTVQRVAFDSHLGLAVARARAGLPPDVEAEVGLDEILESLRGAEVVLRAREVVGEADEKKDAERTRTSEWRGKLVDLVLAPTDENPSEGRDAASQTQVVLFTRAGAFRRFDLADIRSVAPIDPELRRRYEAALDTHAARRSGSRDSLSIVGTNRGPVTLGYLAETPVWRTTFRLVFSEKDEKGEATLQGWALVHNDTDEDWHDVDLELVNGRPDSFLFPLAAPRYERRALEVPEDPLSSVPQLLTTTPDILWGDFSDLETEGAYGVGYGSGSGWGAGFGGRGARVPSVRVGKAEVREGASNLLEVGNLAALAGASGTETETSFVYASSTPLDLGAHQSAMVPFIDTSVGASKVVWFESFDHLARHAVRFVNGTRQTLPEGPVSVYADGGFAGESFLQRLKPGERQFVHVGDDPDTELEVEDTTATEQLQRLAFRNDRLEEHFLRTTTRKLRFVNRSARERDVLVVLPIGSNATVQGAEVDFDAARSAVLGAFDVPSGKGELRTLVTVEAMSRVHPLESLAEQRLLVWADDTRLSALEREAAKKAEARLANVARAQTAITRIDEEIALVEADLERLRGHLQALADKQGTARTQDPIVNRLLAAEDKLAALRQDRRKAEREVESAREEVRTVLEALRPGDAP